MKILLVSASDVGGAGVACLRLLRALKSSGMDARMLVLHKDSDDENVFEVLDSYSGFARKRKKAKMISIQYLGVRSAGRTTKGRANRWDSFTPPTPATLNASHPLVRWADVVHLHWCAQFWDWRAFANMTGKKVVWTFHDLNPVTGGCHFPGECRQFERECTTCPQLKGTRNPNRVARIFSFKRRIASGFSAIDLTIVAPSKWLSRQAQSSPLFAENAKHVVIPYAFEEHIFHPLDAHFCRSLFSLPMERKIVLFASSYLGNYRKGIDLLLEAISLLSDEGDLSFCTAGRGTGAFGKTVTPLGNITDERMMALAYNAADLCVVPSREDNLPNTIGEALYCGTPVVAFRSGGIPEMIDDGFNGVLVVEMSADALAGGIRKALRARWDRDAISDAARKKYSKELVAELHAQVYR